MNINKKID